MLSLVGGFVRSSHTLALGSSTQELAFLDAALTISLTLATHYFPYRVFSERPIGPGAKDN